MMQKIEIVGKQRLIDCLKWLVQNVGQGVYDNGEIMHGNGWIIRYHYNLKRVYSVELSDNVDLDTQLLFALKWS
jgi:hypothetical protein